MKIEFLDTSMSVPPEIAYYTQGPFSAQYSRERSTLGSQLPTANHAVTTSLDDGQSTPTR